jgi:hypothetical protein
MLLLAAYLPACFRYAPADFATVPTGAQLLVSITDQGQAELLEVLGPGAERVDGRLLGHTDTDITLAVASVRHSGLREPVPWNGESVTIPRALVGEVRERSLDRTRSWLVGGLIVLGAILVSAISLTLGGSDVENGGPPPNGEGET